MKNKILLGSLLSLILWPILAWAVFAVVANLSVVSNFYNSKFADYFLILSLVFAVGIPIAGSFFLAKYLEVNKKWILFFNLVGVISSVVLPYVYFLYVNPHPHSTSIYRNGRRIAVVRQLASALELYFNDNKKYPNSLQELVPNYIGVLGSFNSEGNLKPKDKVYCDPKEQYSYMVLDEGKSYSLKFCLPENDHEYKGGYHIESPEGLK